MTVEVLLDDEVALDDLRAAFTVEVREGGRRLVDVVVDRLGVVARRLLVEGRIRVEGRAVLGGSPRLVPGQRVVVLGDRARPELLGERIPLPVLLERDDLLVVDKPAPLAMSPGAGHPAGTVANALRGLGVSLSLVEGALRPGIVHRLDQGTSGALVVAKDDETHRRLAGQFRAHEAVRRYLALVAGAPAWDEREVDAPLARKRAGRKAQGVSPGGRPARTRFQVRERLGSFALVEAVPGTGRTHQIRVHLAHLGHPIVGDTLYGGGAPARRGLGVRRPLLHALRLAMDGFDVEAPWPGDLVEVVARLRAAH